MNSFGTLSTITIAGKTYQYHSLPALGKKLGIDLSRMPYGLLILLENLLRFEDGEVVKKADIEALGLNKLTKSSDCNANTISARNFDFTITQSSPSKGAVGINRYVAKDYLSDESETFRQGFVLYAVAACRVKFGLSASLNSPAMSLVRHKKTPECFEPQPIALTRSECVDSCD